MRLVLARGWGPRPAQTRGQRGGREAEGRFAPPLQTRAERGGTRWPLLFFVPVHGRGGDIWRQKRPKWALERVPYFPLFCVEVGHILHAFLLDVFLHGGHSLLQVHIISGCRENIAVNLIY